MSFQIQGGVQIMKWESVISDDWQRLLLDQLKIIKKKPWAALGQLLIKLTFSIIYISAALIPLVQQKSPVYPLKTSSCFNILLSLTIIYLCFISVSCQTLVYRHLLVVHIPSMWKLKWKETQTNLKIISITNELFTQGTNIYWSTQ